MPNARPSWLTQWSKGKAIYAAGVQFPPVHYNGQTFLPGQANNFYIFPAVGMAIFATQAKRVTDQMFIEAGQAVADQVPSKLLQQGLPVPAAVEYSLRGRDPDSRASGETSSSTPAWPEWPVRLAVWRRLSASRALQA